jgi:hypothetical protein
MTTRRAGTLSNAFKPGPARIHFAYVPIGEDFYYVMGIGSIQLQNRSVGISRPCTGQESVGDPENPVLQHHPDQNSRGHGLDRIPEPHQQTEQAAEPAATQNGELKLLPAPQIAGLLPARVPVPTNGQRQYVQVRGVGVGYLTTVTDREYFQIALIGLSQAAVVWKRLEQFNTCCAPKGCTPYQASVKLKTEQVKVRMK